MTAILQPQVDFPISRQIANHLDVNIYYVQAKVYDADGTLIATVNLTDKGGQRFQKRWRVPADKSGQGAYISIVTSVYTDSNYSTKSNNYGDEENTYLIFNRVTPAIKGGGGSGNVSLSEIRRVIADELDSREKEEDEMEDEEEKEVIDIPRYDTNFEALADSLSSLSTALAKVPTEKFDQTHLLEGIQNLANAIDEKEVTPETDLDPIMEELQAFSTYLESISDKITSELTSFKEEVLSTIKQTMEDAVANTEYEYTTAITPRRQQKKEIPAEKQQKPFDLRKLAP